MILTSLFDRPNVSNFIVEGLSLARKNIYIIKNNNDDDDDDDDDDEGGR